jgi:hypothetical protein
MRNTRLTATKGRGKGVQEDYHFELVEEFIQGSATITHLAHISPTSKQGGYIGAKGKRLLPHKNTLKIV